MLVCSLFVSYLHRMGYGPLDGDQCFRCLGEDGKKHWWRCPGIELGGSG